MSDIQDALRQCYGNVPLTSGHMSVGHIELTDKQKQDQIAAMAALFQGQRFQGKAQPMFDGSKPIVVCGGEAKEAKDMDAAQALAEELAHKNSANAYILKPVRTVAPKRDVVTTDLV